MKKTMLFLSMTFILSFAANAQGWLNKVGAAAKDAAKRTMEKRDGMSAYFMHLRYGGYWWSRSVSSGNDLGSGFQLNYYGGNASLYTDDKYTALSVRCLKNDE